MAITITGVVTKDRNTVEPGLTLVDPTSPANVQPVGQSGWTLQFSDEFNGNSVDRLKWDSLYPNWPNFTSQNPGGNRTNTNNDNYYNDNNVALDGSSNLVLTMQPDTATYPGLHYKSGMLQSLKSYTVSAGCYVEARLRIPNLYDVIWPAAWMSNSAYATWPPEIDFFEHYGQGSGTYLNTYLTESNNDLFNQSTPSDITIYHTYAVKWNTNSTQFYIDGSLIRTANLTLPGSQYLILNLAARTGQGAPGGNPTMLVDYIRAWR